MMGRWCCVVAVMACLALDLALPAPGVGQEDRGVENDLTTAEAAVKSLYGSLSFGPGGEPDWAFVRSLFIDEAVVVFAEGAGGQMRALSPDEFIEDFRAFYTAQKLVEHGFAETADRVEITTFGNLAQVFVVFQPRIAGRAVGRRGLDCLQLTRLEGRWWITSIITDWEGPTQPIPERLGGGRGKGVGDAA